MKTEIIHSLTTTFEGHAQKTESGIEFWLARDIQHLLGYTKWDNFLNVVSKAKTACAGSAHPLADHFADVGKTIQMPKGAEKDVPDIMLTRYACYLIAQNGDPKKQEIAFAQTYFAIQTRRAELIEQRLLETERLVARKKLTLTEKELSAVIYEQTGGNQDFASIRSKGDQALFVFGKSTQAMKAQWQVPDARPLADFAPTILLKAMDFAAEITIFNSREHQLASESAIAGEHITNNDAVRRTLLERGSARNRCPRQRMSKRSNVALRPKTKNPSRSLIRWNLKRHAKKITRQTTHPEIRRNPAPRAIDAQEHSDR